jgi:hypothetical protein
MNATNLLLFIRLSSHCRECYVSVRPPLSQLTPEKNIPPQTQSQATSHHHGARYRADDHTGEIASLLKAPHTRVQQHPTEQFDRRTEFLITFLACRLPHFLQGGEEPEDEHQTRELIVRLSDLLCTRGKVLGFDVDLRQREGRRCRLHYGVTGSSAAEPARMRAANRISRRAEKRT